MKNTKLALVSAFMVLGMQISAHAMEMQHGFILSNNDNLGSHLVANGHHSRQVEIIGKLEIQNPQELDFYKQRKRQNQINQTYFLFQAQHLDLPKLKAGNILQGHIVESRIGNYEPKNIIVSSATFQIQRVLLNIANPFFETSN